MSEKVFSLNLVHVKWLLIFSYLGALVIDNMLILSFENHYFPPLTLLLLLFWASQILSQTHLFTAFLLGLLFDTFTATPLGSHALLFITVVFFMLRSRHSFKSFPMWQQALMVGVDILLYQVMGWFVFSPTLVNEQLIYYWLAPVIASLVWPILSVVMKNMTHRAVYQ